MAKNVFQDMVNTKRARTALHQKSQPRREVPVERRMERREEAPRARRPEAYVPSEGGRKRGGRRGLWVVALISIIFFLFALSFFFAHAEVTVTPKSTELKLNENLSATKDSSISSGLSFDLVVISGEESKTVAATEQKETSVKATGTAVLYNAFSGAPQPLLIDTRLEGSNGKIYKTVKAVTIPGMKGDTPGSVEVGIYADVPGPEGNSDPLDFKIFGFKGSPKYAKFYGRSKGAVTGGVQGLLPIIPPEEQARATADLRNTLRENLLQKARDQIPAGFILFKDAAFLVTNTDLGELSTTPEGGVITLKGTLYGFLFSEERLTEKLVKDKVTEYEGTKVTLSGIRDLTFNLSNKDVPFADINTINFTLSGTAQALYQFDTDKLRGSLLGKPKKYLSGVLLDYPYIDSAELKLSPFWSRTLPKKSSDIEISVVHPK